MSQQFSYFLCSCPVGTDRLATQSKQWQNRVVLPSSVFAVTNSNRADVKPPSPVQFILRNSFRLDTFISQAGRLHTRHPVLRSLSLDGFWPDSVNYWWFDASSCFAGATMFYIICRHASQWAVLNYLCGSERQNGWCQLKCEVCSLLGSVKKHGAVFVSSAFLQLKYFVLHLVPTWRTSTSVALLCCLLSHVSSCRRESPGTQRSLSCSWRENWCRPDWRRPSPSVPSKRCKTRSWTWRRWASWDMMRCSDFCHQPVLLYDPELWNGVKSQDTETSNRTASQKETPQACINLRFIRETRRYQMTPMWHVFKRSWSGWSWGRQKLWQAWRSWGSKSEIWRITGRSATFLCVWEMSCNGYLLYSFSC